MLFRGFCGFALLFGSAAAGLSNRKPFFVSACGPYIYFLTCRVPVLDPRFDRVPTGSVKPAGWALNQARIQADGLAGHLRDFDS